LKAGFVLLTNFHSPPLQPFFSTSPLGFRVFPGQFSSRELPPQRTKAVLLVPSHRVAPPALPCRTLGKSTVPILPRYCLYRWKLLPKSSIAIFYNGFLARPFPKSSFRPNASQAPSFKPPFLPVGSSLPPFERIPFPWVLLMKRAFRVAPG